ncbi:NUDIX hydrolase [Leifsonia sp. NPDC058292]|uniref:NUDIX hydrolase n=1 Tax=Leifsonia sp. NPDC058292 TaxID=3346428 RepID=UPI0036DDFEB7
MPHLHTRDGEHDLTASAFIVSTSTGEPRILVHRHKKLGVLLQPGGHVELDEDPWTAVLREIREESGFAPEELEVLQPAERLTALSGAVVHPQPACIDTHPVGDLDHKHIDLVYAFVARLEPAGEPAAGESPDLLWMTVPELRASTATYANVVEIAEFVVDVCLPNWDRVGARRVTDSHSQSD